MQTINLRESMKNHLTMGGLDVARFTKEYGTPLILWMKI